jgi:hypothetical protein
MKHIPPPSHDDDFYVRAIRLMRTAEIPFLVGGAYALRAYTGIIRDTKDFDVFLRPSDVERALAAFRAEGFRAEVTYSHWLAKVHYGEAFIDIIYRAGNGLCEVDDRWFRSQAESELMGENVPLVPIEEIIWQKAYIQERERFDGADIAHLLRCCAEDLDWEHLIARFGDDFRVLLAHLLLFGFVYPGERHRLPQAHLTALLDRAKTELAAPATDEKLCQGTLVSRAQYLPDIERWGYRDARTSDRSRITAEEIEAWTNAIGKERAWA